jgi:signal transduction histidine kinase
MRLITSRASSSAVSDWGDWRGSLFRRLSVLLAVVWTPLVLVGALSWRGEGALFYRVLVLCLIIVLAIVAIAATTGRCQLRQLALLEVGVLVTTALVGVARFGIGPAVVVLLVSAVITVALFFGTRAVWLAAVLTTLLLLLVGFGVRAHLLRPQDPRTLFDWSRMNVWVRLAAAYFGGTVVISSTVSTILGRLEGSLRERDRLLAAEREARAAAERAIGVRDEFLAIAAHELRTPCTSLGLALQGLARMAKGGRLEQSGPTVERLIDTALRQAANLNLLNERLLEVSSIASGQLTLTLSDVDLVGLVRSVVARASEPLRASRSALVLDAREPVVGRWDRCRLEHVVGNLLSNAIRYGAGAPIELGVQASGDRAWLVVRDHGTGIAPEDQARIFHRFERAAPYRHYGGLGLGLYIVGQTVERLGGRVECASKLGEGSTFTVVLPRQASPK